MQDFRGTAKHKSIRMSEVGGQTPDYVFARELARAWISMLGPRRISRAS